MTDFTDDEIQAAWELAEPLPKTEGIECNPATHRMVMPSGVTIVRDKFNIKGPFGWTIKGGRPEPFTKLSVHQIAAKLEKQKRGL